jgi:DNA-binding transcriptional MerR regulator
MSEALLPLLLPAADSTGARAQKSISAFRTISEVAEELDVAQHVLRFWESKFTQVRPLKRGGGRRYYRPEDVDLLRQIRSLLYDEGYTIKGAQKLLRARRSSARGGTGGEPPTSALPPTIAAPRPPAVRSRPPGTAETRLALTALRDELLELKELMAKVRAELG